MAEKKMQLSEKERKRRSELAKNLHKGGRFGGPQKGSGRPKAKRATAAVAEAAKEDASQIVKTLRGLMKSESDTVRLKALLAYLEIEGKEADRQAKEEQREYENLSRDKLLEMIGNRFKQLKQEGVDVEKILFGRVQQPRRKSTQNSVEGNGRALESGEQG